MAAQTGQVTAAIQNIAAVSEEQSASTEEVSASTEEMSAQVEEMNAQAQELAQTAAQLQNLVSRFKLEDDAPQASTWSIFGSLPEDALKSIPLAGATLLGEPTTRDDWQKTCSAP